MNLPILKIRRLVRQMERLEAEMRLVGALVEGELDARDNGWMDIEAARKAAFA